MQDESDGKYRGEGEEDTCDHGMSRRGRRVKPSTS